MDDNQPQMTFVFNFLNTPNAPLFGDHVTKFHHYPPQTVRGVVMYLIVDRQMDSFVFSNWISVSY